VLTGARAFWGDVAAGLATFFFPSRCRACGADLGGGGPAMLCRACRAALAAPLPAAWEALCALPGAATPTFRRFPYDGPAGAAVRLLKYERRRKMAATLAAGTAPLAAASGRLYNIDCIVPVPLHPRRRRERGFNQAEEMGKEIAAAVHVDFLPRGLARVRDTTPQVKLTGEERRRNVIGAFAARGDLAGRRVMVVDDVITTGATARECARALAAAGAAAVVCVAAAGGDDDGRP